MVSTDNSGYILGERRPRRSAADGTLRKNCLEKELPLYIVPLWSPFMCAVDKYCIRVRSLVVYIAYVCVHWSSILHTCASTDRLYCINVCIH